MKEERNVIYLIPAVSLDVVSTSWPMNWHAPPLMGCNPFIICKAIKVRKALFVGIVKNLD